MATSRSNITESTHLWSTSIKCNYCENCFIVDAQQIHYDDLRQPFMFIPDWQYFASCPKCQQRIPINNIPTATALWIQAQA